MENENKLPEDFKKRWVAALRSGEYKQGKSNLYIDGKYCCLGVACIVAGMTHDTIDGDSLINNDIKFSIVPIVLHDSLGDNIGLRLAIMNDNGKSFSEIADYIEENL